MKAPLSWERYRRTWPNANASEFIQTGGMAWHVQMMGNGPPLLLLHGTGASTHSWRDVLPILAKRYTVIAPDLPGHAFSGSIGGRTETLEGMAKAVSGLIEGMSLRPALVVGHSAGAAIALQMAINGGVKAPVIGLNPALTPFAGMGEHFFPALAKLLLVNPFVPRIFSGISRLQGNPKRFLQQTTGSQVDAEGTRCYAALFANHRHCRGALAMMANWDLTRFQERLASVSERALLIHADKDKAVPLTSVNEARERIRRSEFHMLEGVGHLAHEEEPETVCDLIDSFAAKYASLAAGGD